MICFSLGSLVPCTFLGNHSTSSKCSNLCTYSCLWGSRISLFTAAGSVVLHHHSSLILVIRVFSHFFFSCLRKRKRCTKDALIFFKEPVFLGFIDSFPPHSFSVLTSFETTTLLLIISLLQANVIALFYLFWDVMLIIFKFLKVEA